MAMELKKQYKFTLSDFKGVDLSTSPLTVPPFRAIYMRNWINENGVNKKRNGWREKVRLREDDENLRVNGLWSFLANGEQVIVCYAGTRFYRLTPNLTTGKFDKQSIAFTDTEGRLKDQRAMAFVFDDKLWIIGCGDYLVYSKDSGIWALNRVQNGENTYIPVTTAGIENSSVTGDATLETIKPPNMLNSYRKNTMLGLETYSLPEERTYLVDSKLIDAGSNITIEVEYNISGTAVTETWKNVSGGTTIYLEGTSTIKATVDFATGKIILDNSVTSLNPIIEGKDNITVTFSYSHVDFQTQADLINNGTIGIMFGEGGNANRLFVSGNADFPNLDIHSEFEDFTYFIYENIAKYGSKNVPLVAYSRIGDGTLAAHKATTSQEPSIYFRQSETIDIRSSQTNEVVASRVVFSIKGGAIGEGAISSYATDNLVGDQLMLSKNGVFGVVLSNNVASNERYAKERSRLINEELRKKPLSEAVSIVYRDKYFLAVDKLVYIADARYKFTVVGDLSDSFNYEWYVWDNVDARIWAVIDDKLYFGSSDGQVCEFEENLYQDISYQTTTAGQLTTDMTNNQIIFYNDLFEPLAVNDKVSFLSSATPVYDEFISADKILGIENNIITVSPELGGLIFNGEEVYADNTGASGLAAGYKYTITDVNYATSSFSLLDELDEIVNIAETGFRLCRQLNERSLYVSEVYFIDDLNPNARAFKVKLYEKGETLTLTNYAENIVLNLTADFIFNQNVVCHWYTPVFDFGTNSTTKTILSMTIATEPTINGEVTFGFETKKAEILKDARGVRLFSFNDIDFNNFTFQTEAFPTGYTTRKQFKNFNYIMFKFKSESPTNCAINNFNVTYNLYRRIKGVE